MMDIDSATASYLCMAVGRKSYKNPCECLHCTFTMMKPERKNWMGGRWGLERKKWRGWGVELNKTLECSMNDSLTQTHRRLAPGTVFEISVGRFLSIYGP